MPPPALLLATEGGRRDGGGLMDLGDSEGLDARPVGAFLMPTNGLLLLLGLVVGDARTSPCASVALPGGRRCLGQPLRPWPLVGLHLVKGAATEVVATEVVATEVVATEVVRVVAVTAEARAAVRAEAKVVATEVVRAVAEARAAASRGNASMDGGASH